MSVDTAERLLAATRETLLTDGYADLSTRKVAEAAGVPLSQIHYHFGGKKGMVLALLGQENEKLLARQRTMYGQDAPLWKRYEQACDFLEDDLASGYVRVLQEMMAAGWSDPEIAKRIRALLDGWRVTLLEVAEASERKLGGYGPFTASQVGDLVCFSFLGAEAVLLLTPHDASAQADILEALRRVGYLIRSVEEASAATESVDRSAEGAER